MKWYVRLWRWLTMSRKERRRLEREERAFRFRINEENNE